MTENSTSYPQSCDGCGKVFKLNDNTISVTESGIRGSKIRTVYHFPKCYANIKDNIDPNGVMGYEWIYEGVRTLTDPQINKAK